jgi:hypothetical protein
MENLKKQMDDQTQKKKYTGIMTEHERKINQKDIEVNNAPIIFNGHVGV